MMPQLDAALKQAAGPKQGRKRGMTAQAKRRKQVIANKRNREEQSAVFKVWPSNPATYVGLKISRGRVCNQSCQQALQCQLSDGPIHAILLPYRASTVVCCVSH